MRTHHISWKEILPALFVGAVMFFCTYAVVGAQNPACTPGSTDPDCQFTGVGGSQPPAVGTQNPVCTPGSTDPRCAYTGLGGSQPTPNTSNPQSPKSFKELVELFLGIIKLLVPVIFGLALVVFLWGITKAWILTGGDESEVAKGKQIALWGVIALVVMVGVWGIVSLLRSSLF